MLCSGTMHTSKIVVLFLFFLTIGVASHRLILQDETDLPAQTLESGKLVEEAEAQQRILAELEQVHQLRERMLQAGKTAFAPFQPLGNACMHHFANQLQLQQSISKSD